MAEHAAVNCRVVGSSPTWGANNFHQFIRQAVNATGPLKKTLHFRFILIVKTPEKYHVEILFKKAVQTSTYLIT